MNTDPGLFEALRRASGTALAILQGRLELATLELSQARRQMAQAAVLGLFAVLLLVVGLVVLSVCVVLLLWDRAGLLGLAGMGVIYLLVGLMLVVKLKKQVAAQPRLLQETNAELHRDSVMLRGTRAATDHS